MMNDFMEMQYYYEQGIKAYDEKKYELAANMFKNCWEIYNDAELLVFIKDMKDMGEAAFEKYSEICDKHLNYKGLDDILEGK